MWLKLSKNEKVAGTGAGSRSQEVPSSANTQKTPLFQAQQIAAA